MSKYLISDTREKKNQHVLAHFDRIGIRYDIAKLDFGDYMDVYRHDISIDRKQNIAELAKNCTSEHDRFKREIERAQNANSTLVILVEQNRYKDRGRWIRVESVEDLMLWSVTHKTRSGREVTIRGEKIYRVLRAWMAKYGIDVQFCDKRQTGKRIIEILYDDKRM